MKMVSQSDLSILLWGHCAAVWRAHDWPLLPSPQHKQTSTLTFRNCLMNTYVLCHVMAALVKRMHTHTCPGASNLLSTSAAAAAMTFNAVVRSW